MAKDKKKIVLNKTKEGKHVNIFLIFTMVIVMAVLSLGSLAAPDREKSDNENRFLTQKPKFSIENVLEGKFETQLEDYLSDQIIGRENWIKIMSTTLKSVGYKDVNGVYLMDAISFKILLRTECLVASRLNCISGLPPRL